MKKIHLIKDHDGVADYTPASEEGDFANGIWVRIPVDRWGVKGNWVFEFTDPGATETADVLLEGSCDGGSNWFAIATILLRSATAHNPLPMKLQLTGTVEAIQQEVTLWPLMRVYYDQLTGTYPDINSYLVI